jgi:hypothetical protein
MKGEDKPPASENQKAFCQNFPHGKKAERLKLTES